MTTSCPLGFFLLGVITKTHGVKGALRARLDVYDLSEYSDIKQLFFWKKTYSSPKSFGVLSFEPQPSNEVIIYLEEIDTIEKASPFVGLSICLPDQFLKPLDGNKFYYHEVIGFEVVDESIGPIGLIHDVYEMPAQDLLSVLHLGKEILIPIHDAFIVRVDREKRTIFTVLPEGLLELE